MYSIIRERPAKTIMILLFIVSLLLALAAIARPAFAESAVRLLKAQLTGEAEVPGPGDLDGSGSARIRLFPNEGMVCFTISVKDIMLPAALAHIHVGTADVAGPIVVHLTPPDASGFSKGCMEADEALIRDIYHNPANYYVNVHTADFPAGAVRGQLTK
jgi:hypothetical protein